MDLPGETAPVSAPPVSAPPSTVDNGGQAPPVPEKPGTEDESATAAEPPAPPAESPAPEKPAPPSLHADAEQVLAGYRWRYDPDTLREVVEGARIDELAEVRRQLTEKLDGMADNGPRARLLSLRAVVSRLLGDLDKALSDGKLALAHAEATGQLRRIAIAQARLAHVMQWRGEYEEADRLFTLANSTELPDRLRATMHHQAGKCAYDQGRFIEACTHFEKALELRKEEDPDLIEQTELTLDAVFRGAAEKGFGPYPRSRGELLRIPKPLTATLDEHTRRWGFTDDLGVFRIAPRFTDVQPFREGTAWVQRPGSRHWELINEVGDLLIDHTAGYRGVGGFSDGIAWVSRDGTTGWIAVDRSNKVLVSTGFDDVRPFRRGLAAVRRDGRWGAVDSTGKLVVPLRYDGFATALFDGRYIDGFSDDGLAVVALGPYKGVVERAGRMLVSPMHPAVVIHPVALLFATPAQRWGALDRRGRPLLEAEYASRAEVADQLERLLTDARPIL
ncbi:WG repeat-containing protein [Planosporangium mesophilum]|uniref:WG repeat-containing protein n=1 Tax=Planosporangium mesophilum TaxID=689768 RepID=UPI001EF1709E|nr:WG repeat-containing protein [Planosporangium mesophilum]